MKVIVRSSMLSIKRQAWRSSKQHIAKSYYNSAPMAILDYVEKCLPFLTVILFCFWWLNKKSLAINQPIFGMLPILLRNAHRAVEFATLALQQFGGTIVFRGPWFLGLDFVITSDPVNVHYILSKNVANYHKGLDYKQILEPFGDGFVNSDGVCWRNLRRIVHSLLKDRKFELSLKRTIQQKVLDGLFPVLDHASKLSAEFDLQDVFKRFTYDNICLLVLGYDPNSLSVELPHVPHEQAFNDMEDVMFKRHVIPQRIWKLQKWVQFGEEKKMKNACEIFDGFLHECISRKKELLSRNAKTHMEEENFYLLKILMMKDEDEKSGLEKSDKFLRDMAFNLMEAGKNTICAGLVWLFWLVAVHPLAEEKILDEIKAILIDENRRFLSFEELSKLTYLHATICETLRLYPPIPLEYKVSVEPDVLPSGHRVRRNSRVIYSLHAMGRREDIWGEDCLEFKPERWISEQGEIIHVSSYKFIAFNAGQRTCLGKDLAIMQMKAVASALIWNYRFQVIQDHPVSPRASMMLLMKHGLKVKVSKRSMLLES